ncbi:hypothetical protein Axy20_018 [Achromobacter phage vB_AxyS_19-32_Axy20]|nr:hypothetical protein Axy20_018 [Achromobacter phage vB_AxyS_19-32_Axy20]
MIDFEAYKAKHPEFVFEGMSYWFGTHGRWMFKVVDNNLNESWRNVPSNWTRILRELPTMESFERERLLNEAAAKAFDAVEAQVKPMKVAIVGGEAVIPVATALALRDKLEQMIGDVEIVELPPKFQGYALDVMAFDECCFEGNPNVVCPDFAWLGGKYPKAEGSKIAKRFERNTTKGSGRMGGTPDVRKNRRSSIRIAYRVINDARKRHIGLGYFAKRYPSYWRDAVRVIERAIKGDRFGDWPMKTVKV